MDKNHCGKVHYVCFYWEPAVGDKIDSYPSVISKIDYIAQTVKETGREVNIVSVAPARKGFFAGCGHRKDAQENHTYLPSMMFEQGILRKLSFLVNQILILFCLLKTVKKEDTLLVYHSLYNRVWLKLFKRLSRCDIVLQIEDVFSELTPENKRFQEEEWKLLRSMGKCICVNDLVYEKLDTVRQKIVSYGSYLLPPKYDAEPHDTVRLVYAGVIEQERKAAFLAIEAMCCLPEQYELSVLGFGKDEDLAAMTVLIENVNRRLGRQAVAYHGRLSGESYWRFLQSCDLALSTHAYTEESLPSANHTFPSKVLTYLANGLCVVAQKLDVLQRSSISEFFSFYDTPVPEEIAKAICTVVKISSSNPRKRIEDLNEDFVKKMGELLKR